MQVEEGSVSRIAVAPPTGGLWAGRRLLVAGALAVLFALAGAGLAADWLAGSSGTLLRTDRGATLVVPAGGGRPGATLRMTFAGPRAGLQGHRTMRLGTRGDLLLTLPGEHVVRAFAPVAYQLVDGHRRPVRSRFVRAAGGDIAIDVGAYDARRRLVIDPVLAYGPDLAAAGGTSTGSAASVTTSGG
jgi:hypothetical protein